MQPIYNERVTAHQREVLHDFRITVTWSLLGSAVMSFFFRGVPQVISIFSFGILMPAAALVARLAMRAIRFRSFILTVLAQTVVITIAFSAAFFLAIALCIMGVEHTGPFNPEVWSVTAHVVFRTGTRYAMLAAVALAFVITAIAKFSNKLGPGVLWNWITGKYHDPKEETRLFMFLDIKDSTTLAEQLGNLKFSAMVRDFFADMAKACFDTKAEVSHYIGDEAVISWKPLNGKKRANCVRFYFLVEDVIAKRAAHYRAAYGFVPEFKAGLHVGAVVATEVGEAKSEIVFHGDVMNTTARIQGLCGPLNRPFLISEEARACLELAEFAIEDMGEHELKGKELPVRVHAVARV